MTRLADKIIVALDLPAKKEALHLVEQLQKKISFFKIGLQLYTAEGPEIVRAVLSTGAKVFLDLKFHDIPNTVARAVQSASKLGVQMLTIHLSGGLEMILSAVAARTGKIMILGVTVLTSVREETLEVGGSHPRANDMVQTQVLLLAKLGIRAGVDGVVASGQEIKMLRSQFGDKIQIVVPGIRPTWAEAGDQKRTMTPREAINAGADYLVIGRPITKHPNPEEAVEKILAELGS